MRNCNSTDSVCAVDDNVYAQLERTAINLFRMVCFLGTVFLVFIARHYDNDTRRALDTS